ncbi:MAG: VWA domain-containing protein [Bryobacterales bacterium]|nr:VWA domain-containing protein [Bryobacterales bacterium]
MNLFLLFWACATLFGQDAVFRADVSLVRVDAQVIHRGNIVRNLAKTDFSVRDNGEPREILYFGLEQDPLDVILILDTSGSMDKAIGQVNAAARAALNTLRNEDRVAVIRFTRHAVTAAPFTEDRAQVASTIAEICGRGFGGGTDIHGALQHAAAEFLNLARSRRRRAILLVSDGQSESYHPKQDVLRKLWEADAVMNSLQVQGPRLLNGAMNLRMRLFGVDLKELARETGGEVLKANHIGEDFRRMLERMRQRYSLHFAPASGLSGQQRSIVVELSDGARKRYPQARVLARRAYVSP